jgi:cytochrome c-type biogenesis protein CcmH/NrfG
MDSREIESIVGRLVQNPHDHEALTMAHQAGQSDPKVYATILERVGNGSTDPALACYWLTEAANVWTTALSDAPRAARALMAAIERDPTQAAAADRLAELYRERGDAKALVALLERRSKALTPLAARDSALRQPLAQVHEELGRLWNEPPLSQTKKAADNYRKAIEFDPTSQFAIYALRELLKAEGAWSDAIPYFELEQRIVDDPERKLALYQDEANVRRSAGDLAGAAVALRNARGEEGGTDPALKQFLATIALERVQSQQPISDVDRQEGAQLFVELAEEYPGDHGLSYAVCALEIDPRHDRAAQLAMYYGEQLNREAEVARHAAGYLKANPGGALAPQAREFVNRLAQQGLIDDSLFEALAPAADAPALERVQALLDQANALARKARKPEAAEKYQQVLELDRANEEAVAFMEGYFRQRRKYPELRDLLMAASLVADAPFEARHTWLRELAGLCETQLRDVDSAIKAWQELVALEPEDENSREQLRRLFERAGRWDDLVVLLEQEAEQEADVERRVGMERTIAKIHEQKRRDPVATGQTWARVAALLPDDETAILSAVRSFEKGERFDLAVQVIAENVTAVSDEVTRAQLYQKLGEMREAQRDFVGAGDAFTEAAQLAPSIALWASAERCYVEAEAWDQAATAADERAQLLESPTEQAELFATVAFYLVRSGDESSALLRLEQATQLDPNNDEYADQLEKSHEAAGRQDERVIFLLRRAEMLTDAPKRRLLRKRASELQRDVLEDPDAARESLVLSLTDGDDVEVLTLLADDAEQRGEAQAAVEYLARLAKLLPEPGDRVGVMLREAKILADMVDDPASAVDLYETILRDFQPNNAEALTTIAELHERLDNPKGVADALERRLASVDDPPTKLEIAKRLADLYEVRLEDPGAAISRLDIVRGLDPEDYDALRRLSALAEQVEDWPRFTRHLSELIGIEGDEEELSVMTRRLAQVLNDNLGKSDEALAALLQIADLGDVACREEYVKLGDSLGWKGIVASKLVEWHLEAPSGDDRNEALRGAFDRFVEVGRDIDAAKVARELVHSRAADAELASQLENIAVKLKDLEALEVAHDLMVQELSGSARAEEAVRQAEVLAKAGVELEEAIQHGEQALTSVNPVDVEPLLQRLADLAKDHQLIMGLYERQVTRCKLPQDRLMALGRAAQIAAEFSAMDRAREFFDIALGGSVQPETLDVLEGVAAETDTKLGKETLRRTLAEAMSAGGQGSRDGGRTRGMLLRRAAALVSTELKDLEQAFTWLGDALITHVDDEGLDELEALARDCGDLTRIETVLSRALEEVFDGPLVRKILSRRAQLRAEQLNDKQGAAGDLKRLHDLTPADQTVIQQLGELYEEIGDHKGMVQLLEDQILRGKDPALRTDLARKVARLWEEKLADAREAADAWRRVLRMKSGDPEATEGLDRAKSNMLKRSSSDAPSLPPDSVEDSISAKDAHAEPPAESRPKPVAPGRAHPPNNGKAAGILKGEVDLDTLSDQSPDLDLPRRDTLTSSTVSESEGVADSLVSKELEEDTISGIEVDLEADSAEKSADSHASPAKSPPMPPRKKGDSSEDHPGKADRQTTGITPPPPIGQSATVSGAPARRPPPPPPMRSSARPPPPVPPTKGAPGVRMPPPPPSVRPNVPAPPSPVRPSAPVPAAPLPEVEETEEEGISVDDSELLE